MLAKNPSLFENPLFQALPLGHLAARHRQRAVDDASGQLTSARNGHLHDRAAI
jgi:hypothetical protein